MPAALQKLLSYEFTIAELIGLAIMLAAPYGLIGLVWAFTHTDRFAGLHGISLVVSFVVSVLIWPVLAIPGACPA